MKFLYVDESGNRNDDRFLTFFGVQIDAYKLKAAMRVARPILRDVADAFPENLNELKTSRMVNGCGGWRHVEPATRKQLFRRLCGFLANVSGVGLLYVLDRERYASAGVDRPQWATTPWMTGAISIAMFAQSLNQVAKNNKGLTVLIFDDNKVELPKLSAFLVESCPDVDEFYGRSGKAEPFDHIVDTAFAIKSEQSELVQVSDACAYAIRRKAELELGGEEEAWKGEQDFIHQVCSEFAPRVRFPARTWVASPHCRCAEWVRDVGCQDLKRWVTQ